MPHCVEMVMVYLCGLCYWHVHYRREIAMTETHSGCCLSMPDCVEILLVYHDGLC